MNIEFTVKEMIEVLKSNGYCIKKNTAIEWEGSAHSELKEVRINKYTISKDSKEIVKNGDEFDMENLFTKLLKRKILIFLHNHKG